MTGTGKYQRQSDRQHFPETAAPVQFGIAFQIHKLSLKKCISLNIMLMR
jgi:hypothetical protein